MVDVPSSIITPMSHIAVSSVTRASITVILVAVGFTAAISMGLLAFKGAGAFTLSQVHAPARSVASITAAMPEAFPLAGGRVLEVAPVAVVSMVAVAGDIADRMCPR